MPEIGRARYVPIEKLEAGMKVHRDVYGRGGKTLVSAGEILTKTHVDKLRKWETREKPVGPVFPRKNPKDRSEPIRRSEYQGGWKPSHFNRDGVLVSSTLASGAEFPDVEAHPEKSKTFQAVMRAQSPSVAVPSETVFDAIEAEIKDLESTNAQIGGTLHTVEAPPETMEEFEARRDELIADNDRLKGNNVSSNGRKQSSSISRKNKRR